MAEVASRYYENPFFLYLGRHVGVPVCFEGALKLKEISYVPTEAYPAGEMKHGPIALLDEGSPVVCVATDGHVFVRDGRTGELAWKADLDAGAISRIAAVDAERAAALLADGTARGVDATGEIWRYDGDHGFEGGRRPSMLHARDRLWVANPTTKRLAALDANTGAVLVLLPLPRGSTWVASRERALIATDETLAAYAVP